MRRYGSCSLFASICLGVGLAAVIAACGLQAHGQDENSNDPYRMNDRAPDSRFKADVLVVVAHPDDEVMVAAYVARLVEQGKRVAIVWTTDGDGGVNDVGPEQASAMGDIREVEGIRAAASLGVANVWNLRGPDTPSQDPLKSLETCNHGRCLDRIVRIVRLTRPEVILTWLPLGVTGEDHGDHQAAGVMATEAFDMAGDPTAFAEQVTPVQEPNQNSNKLEGLRPWQPEKIYYFSNPSHTEFFAGQGPQYPTTDISPKRHVSYAQIAAEEFGIQETQGGRDVEQALQRHETDALEHPLSFTEPTRFILGKSLVPSGVTDDVFAGVVAAGIPFHRAPGYEAPALHGPVIEVGGPWHFYKQFWQAHGIEHVGKLIPNELSIATGGMLRIPLIVENPGDEALDVKFAVKAPAGWKVMPVSDARVAPHTQYFLSVRADAPQTQAKGWQEFAVSAEAQGTSLGTARLQVELEGWALPQ